MRPSNAATATTVIVAPTATTVAHVAVSDFGTGPDLALSLNLPMTLTLASTWL